MIEVPNKIKEAIQNLIMNEGDTCPDVIFFILDDTLGLIDEEYYQCLFPEDEFGGVIYDSAAYKIIETSVYAEINKQLNATSK